MSFCDLTMSVIASCFILFCVYASSMVNGRHIPVTTSADFVKQQFEHKSPSGKELRRPAIQDHSAIANQSDRTTANDSKNVETDKRRIPLYLAGFASVDTEEGGWSSGGCIPAIELALEDVNDRSDILPGYELKWIMDDTKCQLGKAINSLFGQLMTPPTKIMILGGGCSLATVPVARTAPYFNLIQMSYSTGSGELSDKKQFPTFFRTSASDISLNLPKMSWLKHFNWKRVATISHNDHLYSLNDLHKKLIVNGINLITAETFLSNPKNQLENIKKKDGRIIFLNSFAAHGRLVFCEYIQINVLLPSGALSRDAEQVYKIGMYGKDYQWLIPGWWDSGWYDVNDTVCDVTEVKEAIRYAFSFSTVKIDLSSESSISGQTYEEYNIRYNKSPLIEKYGRNRFHTTAYDAVWAVALALNKTSEILNNKNGRDVRGLHNRKTLSDFNYDDEDMRRIICNVMKTLSFHGVSGHIGFDKSGDRLAITEIRQIQGDSEQRVALYFEKTRSLKLTLNRIRWHDQKPPLDGLRTIKETLYLNTYIFAGCCALAILGVILCITFLTFNVFFMECSIIKMSSPRLNNLIIIGGCLTYVSIILFGLDGKTVSTTKLYILCHARVFVTTVAFSLAFGAMFAKTWRVHRIFIKNMTFATQKKLHDSHLFMLIVILVATDCVILCLWVIFDQCEVIPREVSEKLLNSTHHVVYSIDRCTSHRKIYWQLAIYTKNGLLLLFGCFLAFETRRVQVPGLNDSKFIGFSVYNIVVMSIMGVGVLLVIEHKSTACYILTALSLFFCATVTLMLLFVPKMRQLVKHPEARKPSSTARHPVSSTFQYTMNIIEKRINSSRESEFDSGNEATAGEMPEFIYWRKEAEKKQKRVESLECTLKECRTKLHDYQLELKFNRSLKYKCPVCPNEELKVISFRKRCPSLARRGNSLIRKSPVTATCGNKRIATIYSPSQACIVSSETCSYHNNVLYLNKESAVSFL